MLDATVEIVRQRGAGALSVAAIAREAGIHPPGFYSYFKSVDGCGRAAAEELGKLFVSRYGESRRKLFPDRPTRESNLRYIRLTLEERLADRNISEIVLRCRYEDSPIGEVVRRYVDKASAELAKDLLKVAKQIGVPEPDRHVDELELIARLCVATFFDGLAYLLERDDRDLDSTAVIVSSFTYDATTSAFVRWRKTAKKTAEMR